MRPPTHFGNDSVTDRRKYSPQDIEFVLNAHGVDFERYSMICIKSIRMTCLDARVAVYQPTNLPDLTPRALKFYKKNNVHIRPFTNSFLPEFVGDARKVPARHLTLNKLACLQGIARGEHRLFVDADTIVLNDPRPYLTALTESIACPPVDTPEAFGGDWARLYRDVGVDYPAKRITVWERYSYGKEPPAPTVEMVPYFCSGVIYARDDSPVPRLWVDMCEKLERRIDLIPRSYFLDQIAFSVAVQASGMPWHLLPRSFNTHFETLRHVDRVNILHYLNFDALAATIARDERIGNFCRILFERLAIDDGLDLRLQTLTEVPRKLRRLRQILESRVFHMLGIERRRQTRI